MQGRKTLSNVAGIIDKDGGFRVVVTQRWRYHHHVAAGEKLFIVPGYEVREPIPWDDIPSLIKRVELYIDWWIATRNDPQLLTEEAIVHYRKHKRRNPEHFLSGENNVGLDEN